MIVSHSAHITYVLIYKLNGKIFANYLDNFLGGFHCFHFVQHFILILVEGFTIFWQQLTQIFIVMFKSNINY